MQGTTYLFNLHFLPWAIESPCRERSFQFTILLTKCITRLWSKNVYIFHTGYIPDSWIINSQMEQRRWYVSNSYRTSEFSTPLLFRPHHSPFSLIGSNKQEPQISTCNNGTKISLQKKNHCKSSPVSFSHTLYRDAHMPWTEWFYVAICIDLSVVGEVLINKGPS